MKSLQAWSVLFFSFIGVGGPRDNCCRREGAYFRFYNVSLINLNFSGRVRTHRFPLDSCMWKDSCVSYRFQLRWLLHICYLGAKDLFKIRCIHICKTHLEAKQQQQIPCTEQLIHLLDVSWMKIILFQVRI